MSRKGVPFFKLLCLGFRRSRSRRWRRLWGKRLLRSFEGLESGEQNSGWVFRYRSEDRPLHEFGRAFCAKLDVVFGWSLRGRSAAILADVLALDCCSSLMPRWRRLLTLRSVSLEADCV